jgi:hypothetical protein
MGMVTLVCWKKRGLYSKIPRSILEAARKATTLQEAEAICVTVDEYVG